MRTPNRNGHLGQALEANHVGCDTGENPLSRLRACGPYGTHDKLLASREHASLGKLRYGILRNSRSNAIRAVSRPGRPALRQLAQQCARRNLSNGSASASPCYYVASYRSAREKPCDPDQRNTGSDDSKFSRRTTSATRHSKFLMRECISSKGEHEVDCLNQKDSCCKRVVSSRTEPTASTQWLI